MCWLVAGITTSHEMKLQLVAPTEAEPCEPTVPLSPAGIGNKAAATLVEIVFLARPDVGDDIADVALAMVAAVCRDL